MELDNENRNTDPGPAVENDLFSMPVPETASSPASPVQENAGASPEASSPAVEQPPVSEPVREPEFKVNTEDYPQARMLKEVPPAPQPAASVPHEGKAKISLRSAPGVSLGSLLAEARQLSGFSIQSVSAETRIRIDYIEALESDKINALPNPLFLKAYVRALIQLYNLDCDSAARVEEQLQGLEPTVEVPEKLVEDIGRGGQISEAETRRLKMILIYGSIILLLLVSLVVTSVIAVSIRNKRVQAERIRQEDRPFKSSQLEPLLPPQFPKPQMLPVPASSDTKNPAR